MKIHKHPEISIKKKKKKSAILNNIIDLICIKKRSINHPTQHKESRKAHVVLQEVGEVIVM